VTRDILYLFQTIDNRYVGYVIINMAAVKIVEFQGCNMDDVRHYVKTNDFIRYEWRRPREQKYTMIRSKKW
jgi:hypothetical protein